MEEICIVKYNDIINKSFIEIYQVYEFHKVENSHYVNIFNNSSIEIKHGIIVDEKNINKILYFLGDRQKEVIYIIKNKMVDDIEDLKIKLNSFVFRGKLTTENAKTIYKKFSKYLKIWANDNGLDIDYYEKSEVHIPFILGSSKSIHVDANIIPAYVYEGICLGDKGHYSKDKNNNVLVFSQYYKGTLSNDYIDLSHLHLKHWNLGYAWKDNDIEVKVHRFLYSELTNINETIVSESGTVEEMYAIVRGKFIEVFNENNLIKKLILCGLSKEDYIEKINSLKYT